MASTNGELDEQEYGLTRLLAFSDGVFGFAITLLITTIPFSLGGLSSTATNEQIMQQLRLLLPGFYAYILSFFIVGNYWLVHHRTFRLITKYTTILLWLNLSLLACIVFLPVPTAFLGRYGGNPLITALYAVIQTVITLIYLITFLYASAHHRLLAPSVSQKSVRELLLRSFISLFIFSLSIGVAFLSPSLAELLWLALFIVQPLVHRGYVWLQGRSSPKPESA